MSTNIKKLELEKNNFIRELSQEQFDGVLTSKYRKLFHEYFNGNLSDKDLAKKVESNMELITIYEDGESGKLDPNQYLYSAIVDVALDFYNVSNSFETCLNKMYLLLSYFQLVASAQSKFEVLEDLVNDVVYINVNIDGADELVDKKLERIPAVANSLTDILDEISKHEDVISEVEKTTKVGFVDESLIDGSVKEMFVMFRNSASAINVKFQALVEDTADGSAGAKLDIMKGNFI